ncbi:MAG TPA: ATP-binding protein [Longimicrobiales bacterium]|nr:ATP-binding protein [Longimicrobiales bacterium]
MSVQRALLTAIAIAVAAGILPSMYLLDRRIAAELRERSRSELKMAVPVLQDRARSLADAVMMRSDDMARVEGLSEAVAAGDSATAIALLDSARAGLGEESILVDAGATVWTGPEAARVLLEATAAGGKPVRITSGGAGAPRMIGLAPIRSGEEWLGAAGLTLPINQSVAAGLAGRTRSAVTLVRSDGRVASSTLEPEIAAALAEWSAGAGSADTVTSVEVSGTELLTVVADFGGGVRAIFSRSAQEELAVLPQLRRMAAVSAAAALLIALVLGAALATALARPARELAAAADRLAGGDFDAPLQPTRIRELGVLARAFDYMRRRLQDRLRDLEAANEELAAGQERLALLQAELIQRERAAAAGRLVAEVAHEIRNPVASLRNCLEVLRRRLEGDDEGVAFADLAIGELMRMHDLAEQILDLNRPRDEPSGQVADVDSVVRQIAALQELGGREGLRTDVHAGLKVAMPEHRLKQILLNVVRNAREASGPGAPVDLTARGANGAVRLVVEDRGPGFEPDVLRRALEPFFTTKKVAGGAGLGLFVAASIARKSGGSIQLGQRADGRGACVTITIPMAPAGEDRAVPEADPEDAP